MGIFSGLKAQLNAQKAYKLQSSDLTSPEAQRLYEEAIADGLSDPRYLLGYTTLLVRSGQYEKAKEFLIRIQKVQMGPDQKNTLFINYAACCLKLGEVDKGIRLLERQHQHGASGRVYQTLGVLYVEKFDMERQPDFDALDEAARQAALEAAQAEADQADQADQAEANQADANQAEANQAEAEAPAQPSAREKWQAELEKALAFEKEAVEYDDEDPISLDNLGQFYYRCLGDRDAAKEWFDKAIEQKETQIDPCGSSPATIWTGVIPPTPWPS